MIQQLSVTSEPEWLRFASESILAKEAFPLYDVLRDSLYYPASAFDGDPVAYLGGNILSFIYVDYGYVRDELYAQLTTPGFLGYEIVAQRDVKEDELTPTGWRPTPPLRADGNPSTYKSWIKEPFGHWVIFQRLPQRPESHGPLRFSLLYLCADGVAAFQALFVGNSAVPKAVAVIQPGHGFGLNWTNFEDHSKIFARSVLDNPSGQPELLLYGGGGGRNHYLAPCWPEYGQSIGFLGDTSIGVWRRCNSAGV